MQTKTLYYDHPYLQEGQAQIVTVEPKGNNILVELDQTIFYPEGGGQPSDQGEITGPHGKMKVEFVQLKDGHLFHQGKLQGELHPIESVQMHLKWGARYHNMRVHSAGHLVHDVLMSLTNNLTPVKGSHGKKAYLEYFGQFDMNRRDDLENKVKEAINQDLPIMMAESSYEEIAEKCRFVPAGLPKNKPLRIMQIGTFSPMPDGGVHVKSTAEIGQIIIQEINTTDNGMMIKYRVGGGEER